MAGKVGLFVIAAMTGRGDRLGGMRTVLMVLFDEVQSLDVTGPLEVFTGANAWRASRGEDSPTTSAPRASAAARCGRQAACASRPMATCAS